MTRITFNENNCTSSRDCWLLCVEFVHLRSSILQSICKLLAPKLSPLQIRLTFVVFSFAFMAANNEPGIWGNNDSGMNKNISITTYPNSYRLLIDLFAWFSARTNKNSITACIHSLRMPYWPSSVFVVIFLLLFANALMESDSQQTDTHKHINWIQIRWKIAQQQSHHNTMAVRFNKISIFFFFRLLFVQLQTGWELKTLRHQCSMPMWLHKADKTICSCCCSNKWIIYSNQRHSKDGYILVSSIVSWLSNILPSARHVQFLWMK